MRKFIQIAKSEQGQLRPFYGKPSQKDFLRTPLQKIYPEVDVIKATFLYARKHLDQFTEITQGTCVIFPFVMP